MNAAKEYVDSLRPIFSSHGKTWAPSDFEAAAKRIDSGSIQSIRAYLANAIKTKADLEQYLVLMAFHFGITPRLDNESFSPLFQTVLKEGLTRLPTHELLTLAFDPSSLIDIHRALTSHTTSPIVDQSPLHDDPDVLWQRSNTPNELLPATSDDTTSRPLQPKLPASDAPIDTSLAHTTRFCGTGQRGGTSVFYYRCARLAAAGIAAVTAVILLVYFVAPRVRPREQAPNNMTDHVASRNRLASVHFEVLDNIRGQFVDAHGTAMSGQKYELEFQAETSRQRAWVLGIDSKGVQLLGRPREISPNDFLRVRYEDRFDQNPGFEIFVLVLGDADNEILSHPPKDPRWMPEDDRQQLQLEAETAPDASLQKLIHTALGRTGWCYELEDVVILYRVKHLP